MWCSAHCGGDIDRAHDLFDAYLPLARYEQQSTLGLAVRKYLLAKRGAIASAAFRKPGAEAVRRRHRRHRSAGRAPDKAAEEIG